MAILKFVHIPKTAGTSIENVGREHGAKWGRFDARHLSRFQRGIRVNVWHCPPREFKLGNPYGAKGIGVPHFKTFAVVRNPFDRMISNFRCPHIAKRENWGSSREDLNRWIPLIIAKLRTDPNIHDGHFIPQYRYVYGPGGRRTVNHVLYFEALQPMFNKLMSQYKLPIRLNRHDNSSRKGLTVADISTRNQRLIRQYYRDDFAKFYPNIRVTPNQVPSRAALPPAAPSPASSARNQS